MTDPLLRFDGAREDASHKEALEAAFRRVLERGVYLFGPETAAFEVEFVRALEAPVARGGLAVGSGTAALELALRALGVGRGDEVITVANAGVAGPSAIRATGADVVFCDVDPDSLMMDHSSAASVVGPRTRAVLPVHLYGNVVDIDALRAAVPDVPIVEDCAQAFGSRLRGRPVGTAGDAAAFSFYPTKNLGGLGDGGFLSGRPEVVTRARELANYGRRGDGVAHAVGTMSRMDELQAAALRVKLRGFDDALARRQRLLVAYDEALPSPLGRVGRDAPGEPAVHLYVVRLDARDRVRGALAEAGIATGAHYPVAAHHMPAFAAARRAPLPVSERGCAEVASLPFFSTMPLEAAGRVCAALEAVT